MTDEATKYDKGKPPLHLLPIEPLLSIAEVLGFGAEKYDAHNWRKGMDWSRCVGALLRHVMAWNNGEDRDPESGLSHLAHAGCCIVFLLWYEITGVGNDDRWKKGEEETEYKAVNCQNCARVHHVYAWMKDWKCLNCGEISQC